LQAFSGNGDARNNCNCTNIPDAGPIPAGHYFIGSAEDASHMPGHNPKGNYQRFPILNVLNGHNATYVFNSNARGNPFITRGGMVFHPGLVSDGCITFKSDVAAGTPNYPQSKQFDQLANMFVNTQPYQANFADNLGFQRYPVVGVLTVTK
jgi:hypothetical protein